MFRVLRSWRVRQRATILVPMKLALAILSLLLPATGAPIDDEADMARGCWAGEIPLRLVADPPRTDPALAPDIAPDPAALAYRRPGSPPGQTPA